MGNRAKLGLPLTAHNADVSSLSFNEDGTRLISASSHENDDVMIWDVSRESRVRLACRRANRNLTNDEWRFYLPNSHPAQTLQWLLRGWLLFLTIFPVKNDRSAGCSYPNREAGSVSRSFHFADVSRGALRPHLQKVALFTRLSAMSPSRPDLPDFFGPIVLENDAPYEGTGFFGPN